MDAKHLEELKSGYTFDANGIIRSPGKFEGETLATLYYYDVYLNTRNTVFEVTEEEEEIFNTGFPFVYLAESNYGFASLVGFETRELAEDYAEEMDF